MKNDVTLSGYRFNIHYDGIEYDVITDTTFEVMLFDGSIEPNPEDNNHTPMEIYDFVEQMFWAGDVKGLDDRG
jgi:hypothetical protein